MLMESGMAFEPRFDLRMLMGRVIVHDQMQVEPGWGFGVYLVEETDKFLMPMTGHGSILERPERVLTLLEEFLAAHA